MEPPCHLTLELAQAERRDIVFDYFLRDYEVTVVVGQPLDYYQQQYQDNQAIQTRGLLRPSYPRLDYYH
jgi:hypothetical protein